MQSERKGVRSRAGCWTCRERKIKCDETRPVCQRCSIGKRACDYTPREPPRRQNTVRIIRPRTDLDSGLAPSPATGAAGSADVSPISGTAPSLGPVTARSSGSKSISQESSIRAPSISSVSDSAHDRYGFAWSHDSSPGALQPSTLDSYPQELYIEDQIPFGLGEFKGGSAQLRRVFEHYQSTFLSTMQTKKGKYSFVAGIMHICKTSPVLMHMMLAIVGHQASSLDARKDEQMFAIEEYRRGLAGFATLVGSGQYERQTLLAAFWILMQFEMRFGQNSRDISRHFDGYNSILLSHGPSLLPELVNRLTRDSDYKPSATGFKNPFKTPLTSYKNVVNRLGLWIAYLDGCASTFDMGGSVMDTMQYKYPGSLDRIFIHSREALRELWGDEYPREQEVDDIHNRPAFDLFHHGHILRFKVSELRRDTDTGNARLEKIRDLHAELVDVSEQYASLISVVEGRDPGPIPPSRLILNLRFIVAFFHAVVLEFNRVAYFSSPLPPEGRRALERILDLALVVHETEGNDSLSRMVWPIFLAGVEAWDRVHQNWLMERLQSLSGYGKNVARAYRLLEAVVKQQWTVPGRVDYLEWLRSGNFEEFVLV